jgi:hypothetical protein
MYGSESEPDIMARKDWNNIPYVRITHATRVPLVKIPSGCLAPRVRFLQTSTKYLPRKWDGMKILLPITLTDLRAVSSLASAILNLKRLKIKDRTDLKTFKEGFYGLLRVTRIWNPELPALCPSFRRELRWLGILLRIAEKELCSKGLRYTRVTAQ